jgi:uncharacterized delta-60 repeat protein
MKLIRLPDCSARLRNLQHFSPLKKIPRRTIVTASRVAAFPSLARASSKVTLLLFSVAVLLGGGAPAVHGQSALDGFDPNADGPIRVVVVQPDGKILIGGTFTTLSPNGGVPVARNNIARLNPDGTLDTAFNPNATVGVLCIAVQADGQILVGGFFTFIGGQARNHIARLDATTGAADSWNPGADGNVISIAVQSDNKVLAGGAFANIGGQPRNNIARLKATTGAADLAFDPNANGSVSSIVVQANDKILVGGAFTGANSIGGQTRNFMARLDPTTGLADSFNPNANSNVAAIAVQADGKILAGGNFGGANSIGGQQRNHIARLDPTTGSADSFDPNANGSIVDSIAVQADGKILAGGTFTSIGGPIRNHIARLDPTTGLADSFDPNPNNFVVNAIAVQADGKILAGGDFTMLTPNGGASVTVTRNRIARLETDGRLDRTLDLNTVGVQVNTTAVQPDGKVLIGGDFTTVLGVTRNNIARLKADGTLDIAFDPNANFPVIAIAVQADGKILVGGAFLGANSIGGQTRNKIARLDATTGLADSWNPNANSNVVAITVQADGKILVGGSFAGANSIGGQTRNRIARLDSATGLADSFDPNANGNVTSIAVQADGKILAGGNFNGANSIGGQMRNRIARLDATTGLADSFDPNANNGVLSIAVQTDGKILVGGVFGGANSIGGQMRSKIARLDPTTGVADSFNPNANDIVRSIAVQADGKILAAGNFNAIGPIGGQQPRSHIARLNATTGLADSFNPTANNTVVNSIALQADGKVLAGGDFAGANSIGGQTRSLFARLSNDTAALQNLAVTQSTITWTRGGSSPQVTRVNFESSTDSVTFTALGAGTPAGGGSDWLLTGLSLSTGQNIYIRARGYYRSGGQDGSESITESVRNVFLGVPLASVGSRKVHGATAFDINLPLTGNPGVECRSGGAGNNYQLIFSFANTLTSVGNASVTSGTGSVSSHMLDTDTHNYIVNLTGVSNAQVITVSLTNVNDSLGNNSPSVPISMGALLGDTTGNAIVNASDVSLAKLKSGQVVDNSNFRADVTVSNSINGTDVSSVKSKVGTALP